MSGESFSTRCAAGRWRRLRVCSASIALAFTLAAIGSVFAGDATLQWTPPVTNTDGSPLEDLTSYRAYWNCGAGAGFPFSVTFPAPATSHALDGLPDGTTCRFALTALTSAGAESAFSNEAQKSFPPVPVADPTTGPIIDWAPSPPVPTITLSASPLNVASGQTTRVTWTVQNAQSCIGTNGRGSLSLQLPSGSYSEVLTATTTYTVTCSNAAGDREASVTVRVQ